ncbi:hypothetical protein DFH29DRAFT_1025005 [Suillus ampliporus]|nr:hypothetical protein DFH29DRAFT_1025005 [Suillus ampliporus]
MWTQPMNNRVFNCSPPPPIISLQSAVTFPWSTARLLEQPPQPTRPPQQQLQTTLTIPSIPSSSYFTHSTIHSKLTRDQTYLASSNSIALSSTSCWPQSRQILFSARADPAARKTIGIDDQGFTANSLGSKSVSKPCGVGGMPPQTILISQKQLLHSPQLPLQTLLQNLELSQGITERIPLRLPRHTRRRINDLPFRWLQDIARRSALRPLPSSSFPGGTSIESGSESSDDPHESDPDSNDPDIEEGAETLAMQFYRIELAEQRRLRTVMEHHARESEVSAFAAAGQAYTLGEGGQGIIGAGARSSTAGGTKTLPSTPVQGEFPFSITAGVGKGAKNKSIISFHDRLHQDLSPSPLIAHANPIWTVVQDMREQRMSLCQSLRQCVRVCGGYRGRSHDG